ncbi:DUF3427 domain-containing protein [Bacillus gobiensis]|uniref:DUF3427 domain-containing protein n=1 Tax=Bacillus gobiensis TaxID=1441095 RepID=UPI003D211F50
MSLTNINSKELVLHSNYNRKDIHDIFSPDTIFTPQAGTWGLHGIVKVPNRTMDYIFMVTFNKKQGNHLFNESISQSGVLTWQSQPSQSLTEKRVLDFINHNHELNNIYLFLRTKDGIPYTYLGKLAYLSHDPSKEKPVYFKWQIIDWDYSPNLLQKMNLSLIDDKDEVIYGEDPLTLTRKPYVDAHFEQNAKPNFYAKDINFVEKSEDNKKLGNYGENLVLDHEIKWLLKNGREDLSRKVHHVSKHLGDGLGYDILSYDLKGNKKFIEVKTTRGAIGSPFYISSNEMNFALSNAERFFIYRVYHYNDLSQKGLVYILNTEDLKKIKKEPINFKLYPQMLLRNKLTNMGVTKECE